MAPLDGDLRSLLEKTVIAARDIADTGAKAALQRLAVDADQPFASLSPDERELRRRLRAKARQFGDFGALVNECAYEHWHRMLFARFLAENSLLMHPTGVRVTLEECDDLATDEGAADGWELAARYASAMLPQIFRTDDPLLEVTFAPEHEQKLEKLLGDLPRPVFAADDSLGWVYQFWQKQRKDEINRSEVKIDRDTIGPVTQLFTEHYMVQFLLQNTLGAWWVSRHPEQPLPHPMSYLRRVEDGTLAAGTFPGWPNTARELRVLDPCCGSGHFLVAAFRYLSAFRMAEEGLSEAEAGEAVLRENLFGLEIDARCIQIAAFNLALAAWRRGGYRPLPPLNVACSGLPVGADLREWLKLANDDHRLQTGMKQLWELFQDAPDLGSLIDPQRTAAATLFAAGFAELQPLLLEALAKEKTRQDDDLHFIGVTAQGMAKAGEMLAGEYHLVTTNVPYLGRGKQDEALRGFADRYHPLSKADLATCFVDRCISLCAEGGTTALVTQLAWLFSDSFKHMRPYMLRQFTLDAICALGPRAFGTISGYIVNVGLFVISNSVPAASHGFAALDLSEEPHPAAKAEALRGCPLAKIPLSQQLAAPDAIISLRPVTVSTLVGKWFKSTEGVSTGDADHFLRKFWEIRRMGRSWEFFQSAPSGGIAYDGKSGIVLWEQGQGELCKSPAARIQGFAAFGKNGVLVGRMSTMRVSLYNGGIFDKACIVLTPRGGQDLAALWAYCTSPAFETAVRDKDKKVSVATSVFEKIPFDFAHWQKVADEAGPLPEPYSEDPTQWLFDGNLARTTDPLQVAVARLLGYHWPDQEDDELDALADTDGIVCLPSIAGERPADGRLSALLAAAFGDDWEPAKQAQLLADVEYEGKSLALWLRDGFFKQHCKLFHNRPFIWHLWDGRKDGFSALVNYHKLDGALLERLTYTHLGNWISRQRHANDQGEEGADARLVAAEGLQAKLKLIIEGEPPYDIFVRWKPLHEQPIGWQPDLNDGVRLNIRPFMEAGVLRSKPNIKWGKDRGKNPSGAPFGKERHNNLHFTNAQKHQARREAGLE